MLKTAKRNSKIFDDIINGGEVGLIAKELGLVNQSVRRIFLRECMKRSPDGYAAGVNACNGVDPSLAWIRANAGIFKGNQVKIGPDEIEVLLRIRWLEHRGYKVVGEPPFSLATPLSALTILSTRQREFLSRNGFKTLADVSRLSEEMLERYSWSKRQLEILKQLIEVAR